VSRPGTEHFKHAWRVFSVARYCAYRPRSLAQMWRVSCPILARRLGRRRDAQGTAPGYRETSTQSDAGKQKAAPHARARTHGVCARAWRGASLSAAECPGQGAQRAARSRRVTGDNRRALAPTAHRGTPAPQNKPRPTLRPRSCSRRPEHVPALALSLLLADRWFPG
jgi:hypothetical protein